MSFQDTIQFLVSGQQPITTIEQIAEWMAVAPPTVYGYKNQGTEPKISQVIALNRKLVKEKDCHIIEKLFYVRRSDLPTNRKVQDELWHIHKLSTHADRYFEQAMMRKPKAKQKYYDTIQSMKQQIESLEAEGEQL